MAMTLPPWRGRRGRHRGLVFAGMETGDVPRRSRHLGLHEEASRSLRRRHLLPSAQLSISCVSVRPSAFAKPSSTLLPRQPARPPRLRFTHGEHQLWSSPPPFPCSVTSPSRESFRCTCPPWTRDSGLAHELLPACSRARAATDPACSYTHTPLQHTYILPHSRTFTRNQGSGVDLRLRWTPEPEYCISFAKVQLTLKLLVSSSRARVKH